MNCHESRLHISCWIDGELSAVERNALRLHLEGCEACQAFRDEQKQLTQTLQQPALELDPPGRIWEAIAAEIQKSPAEARPVNRWAPIFGLPRLSYALAASILLMVLSAALINFLDRGDEAQVLAQLEAYHLEAPQNPFLEPIIEDIATPSANPFEGVNEP